MSLMDQINNTPDTTAEFDAEDIAANKAMGILAYIGPLVFVPMFAAKASKFARFHATQGLTCFIFCAICGVISSIIGFIPWVGWLLGLPFYAVSVLMVVLGIINAAKGQAKELPFIGQFKLLK